MATPNYSYEKRQRELAKKRKKEEKQKRKSTGPGDSGAPDAPEGSAPGGQTPPAGGAGSS